MPEFHSCIQFEIRKIGLLTLLNCEATSMTVFTAMCPEEQQTSDNLIVKDNCFITEIFDKFSFSGIRDNSLIIHKSAYHLFSVLISKRGFSSLQTRKTFGKILSGNYRFLIPVIRVTPHNCAYLLHRASHLYAT